MANLFTIDQVKLILNNSQSHILWSMKFITKTINAEKNPECYRGKEDKVVYFQLQEGQQGKLHREEDIRAGQLRMNVILFVRKEVIDLLEEDQLSRDNMF